MSSYASAQVIVGDVNINDMPEVKFCEMIIDHKFLSPKVMINIDYGQEAKRGDDGMYVLDQATRKRREFNSHVAAVQYMEANGWEYVDSAVYKDNTMDVNVYRYHFRRKEGEK
ncbi:hypothetical protein [Persicitalea jodogahamensis]|uniref:Uncharacterized protein n=1 Tax=Persicitalea jodogahamensis TaxID=402147 RepID=A0A8J3GBF6_9BACT|nr:hypothetical protein [Persicitalea jodogahamensis]GHB81428.1 hypothetical protein GCM10007390_40370 [Persicitalea jodogahamensis]